MQTGHLEDWHIVYLGMDQIRLNGIVTGHTRVEDKLPDGARITTSRVKRIDVPNKVATTVYTEYTLGTPNPEFAAMFEGDTGRLLSEMVEDFELGAP